MRQMAIAAGSSVFLAFLVSGCSMSGLKPAPASAAVASLAATPSAAATASAEEAGEDTALSMVTAFAAPIVPAAIPGAPPSAYDGLITKYSAQYAVPERLVRRVIVRESKYNAGARNGPYYGLMQISHATARGMGYGGAAGGLLDAETNLRYAVKYLAGAYLVAGGNEDQAMRYYASGYYYDAKRLGLLEETGLR